MRDIKQLAEDFQMDVYLGNPEKKYFDHATALAQMMIDEIIICTDISLSDGCEIGLFVLADDVFYWASADSEPIKYNEVRSLYEEWIKKEPFLVTKWICKHRNQRPQQPIISDMKSNGCWDDEMEALP